VNVTADTNVLVRVLTRDDPRQSRTAEALLSEAERVIVPMPVLCELTWVLRRGYGIRTDDIASALRALIATDNVTLDRPAAEAGLDLLDAGGDFADGAIAFDGAASGADEFVSFDRQAVTLLKAQGQKARLLA
jgi:predicted nucleic-acid-binding protein